MDENKSFENKGELRGFDGKDDVTNGYTVTSQGGYYSNEPLKNTEENNEQQPNPFLNEENLESNVYANQSYTGADNQPNSQFVFKNEGFKPKKEKKNKGVSFTALVACVIVSAIIGAAFGAGFYALSGRFTSQLDNSIDLSGKEQNNVTINVEDIDATAVEAVAAKVTPSVVGIRTTVSVYNFFYGEQESSGEGSGVIYSEDGYIITNYHVIQEAVENSNKNAEISVFLSNDDETGHSATVVGYNISYDLAVIKIAVKGLPAISFADSKDLNVGQFVVAIGNPGGLQFMGSVTYGVISGLNRVLSDSGSGTAVELIQTDAAINPGNSGGALVNFKGELVGINSSKLVSESYEGMGFAIPSNTTREICDRIIAKEYDPDPYLGITISERYDAETLKKYNFPVGAVVYSVASGSPADEAGIKSGDIITEFNGVAITNYTVLGEVLAKCKPGQTVSLKIYRSNRSYSASITIGSNNSQ